MSNKRQAALMLKQMFLESAAVIDDAYLDKFTDAIIQAAVDQVRAELLAHRQKGDEIARQSSSISLAYNTADKAAYAVNKFIEKGVENDE